MTACVTYERRVEKPRGPRYVRLAGVVSSSSFRVSLRIFEQKRDCSQSMTFSEPSLFMLVLGRDSEGSSWDELGSRTRSRSRAQKPTRRLVGYLLSHFQHVHLE